LIIEQGGGKIFIKMLEPSLVGVVKMDGEIISSEKKRVWTSMLLSSNTVNEKKHALNLFKKYKDSFE